MDRITGKVYVVTGTSSGIGKSIAEYLYDKGAVVYGLARRDCNNRFYSIVCDVTSDESINEAVKIILEKEKAIYGLVNCAGNGIAGALEDCSSEEILKQLDVNTVGPLRMANAVLPDMRKNKEGVIINIGSIGGDFPLPYQGAYSMSKAALRKETEVYRLELKSFGIEACVIEPGDLKTGFTEARRFSKKTEGSVYEAACNRAVEQMAKDEQGGCDPGCVAKKLDKILKKKKLPACVAVGGIYEIVPFLQWLLPYRIIEKLLAKIYHC